jgi:POT family proton-dependent oligopeptide transporter
VTIDRESSERFAPGAGPVPRFPRTFWTANLTELFERSAYYAMASFLVIYLGQLGLGDYWPSTLNSVLWFIIYFLPILSGTIADQVGFRRSLLGAFVLLAAGYFLLGAPVWLGGAELSEVIGHEVTVGAGTVGMVVVGIVLIGVGGSFVKPCISGTVQKTAGGRATLAFAIFYMTVNVGSLIGRLISWTTRQEFELSVIYAIGVICSIGGLGIVLWLYRDPEELGSTPSTARKPRKLVGRILLDMFLVLRSLRFSLFLLVSSGFWFLYSQVYNLVPLYWKKVLETDPPVDIYTAANPLVIVAFQLVVTRFFGRMRPIRSIVVGTTLVGVSMLVNLLPIYLAGDVRAGVGEWIPVGSLVAVMTVALIAFGELFTSARTFEYIGALAPRGQEGLFLGYANLPVALGALAGGPVGAALFHEVMCAGAVQRPDGLLDLDPDQNALGWSILMAIGLGSALLMWSYDLWLKRQIAQDEAAARSQGPPRAQG